MDDASIMEMPDLWWPQLQTHQTGENTAMQFENAYGPEAEKAVGFSNHKQPVWWSAEI